MLILRWCVSLFSYILQLINFSTCWFLYPTHLIHIQSFLLRSSLLFPSFPFSLPRSVCCTVDAPSRKRFDSFLRSETVKNNMTHPIPNHGSVYDYKFDSLKGSWITWQSSVSTYVHNPRLSFAETIVPTKDSICCSFLLSTLILSGKHVLITGPTGTGKSVNITGHIQNDLPDRFLPISMSFSAQTSASQTQVLRRLNRTCVVIIYIW